MWQNARVPVSDWLEPSLASELRTIPNRILDIGAAKGYDSVSKFEAVNRAAASRGSLLQKGSQSVLILRRRNVSAAPNLQLNRFHTEWFHSQETSTIYATFS